MMELILALVGIAVPILIGVGLATLATEKQVERDLRRAYRKYMADSVKAMDEFDRKQRKAECQARKDAEVM